MGSSMTPVDKQEAFVDSLADFVERSPGWKEFSKRDAVVYAVRALTSDIGAAQDFLDACDIDVGFLVPVNEHVVNQPNPNQTELDLGLKLNERGIEWQRSSKERSGP